MWSLGVACPPAQGYFAAHTLSLKTCDQSGQPTSLQDLLTAHQQAQEAIRSSQQAVRLIREREASHSHGSAAAAPDSANQPHGTLATQALACIFIAALTGASQSSEADAAAADNHHCHSSNQIVRV